MLLKELIVRLGLKDDLGSGLDKSESSLKAWSKGMGDIGRKMSASITTPIVAGFASMISSASSLRETTEAAGITFGDSFDTISKASESSAETFGLSTQQFLEASTSMGVFAESAGLSGDAMSDFAMSTINASSDLASFYDVSQSDALTAITAGIRGEYDALGSLGIVLNEAAVNQYAWTHGIAESGVELTEQQKLLARQGAIMDQYTNGPAKDNFDMSSGLSKNMAIFKAELANTSAELGGVLIPYAIRFAKWLTRLTKWVQKLSDNQKKWVVIIAAVAAAIGPVLIAISMMIPAISALGVAFAVLTGPIGLVVLALAGLAIAYKTNFLGFADAADYVAAAVWKGIQPILSFAGALVEAFRSGKTVKELVEQFPGPLQGVITQFLLIADSIGDLVAAFQSGGLSGLLKQIPEELATIGKAFLALHKEIIDLFLEGLEAAWPFVKEFLGNIPGWAWDAIGAVASYLKPKGEEILQGFRDGVEAKWVGLKAWVVGLPSRIFNAVVGVATTLKSKGEAILQGFKDGVLAIWGSGSESAKSLWGWFVGLPGRVRDAIPMVGELLKTLKTKGESILQGFRDGVEAKWVSLKAWFLGLPSRIVNSVTGVAGALYQKGVDMVTGMINGIDARWNDVVGFAISLAEAVWDVLSYPFRKLSEFVPIGPDVPENLFGSASKSLSQAISPGQSRDSATGTVVNVGGIHINGYNKSPEELTNMVVNVINREFRMAGGLG